MAHKTDYLAEQNQKIFLHFILISFDSNVDLALGITLNNAAQMCRSAQLCCIERMFHLAILQTYLNFRNLLPICNLFTQNSPYE